MKSKRGKPAERAPRRANWLIFIPALILFVALVFRTVSLTTFHTLLDEGITRDVVTGIWHGQWSNNWKYSVSASDFRYDQYNFSSYLYADALIAGAAGKLDAFLSGGGPDFVFWSRLFSALAGTLAVLLFYLVARRAFQPATAMVAMFLMAAMPLLVQDSHYARPEGFVVALTGLAYLFLLRFDARRDQFRYLGYAAFCFGLLIASKVSLIPMAAIPFVYVASLKDRASLAKAAGICAGCALLGVFVGVPDAFFHPAAYWHGVETLRHQYAAGRPPHASGGANSVALTATYFWQTTGLLLLFSLAGAFVLARARRFVLLAALGGPVAFYLLFFSLQAAFFERNLSHIAPLLAILAAVALTALSERVPAKSRTAALIGLAVFTAAPALWVSGKLVFEAMRIGPEERALPYEVMLSRTIRNIEGSMPIFTAAQLKYLTELDATLDQDALVRIPDFHDSFTKKHLAELEQRTGWREVGYFPSVLEGYDVSTMVAYHAVSFRYLLHRLRP